MSKKTIASDSNENRNHLCNKKGSTPTHCRVSKKLLAMYEEECGETLSMTQLYKTICSLTKSEIELLTKKSKKWRPNFFKLQLDISDKDLSDKVDISIRKSPEIETFINTFMHDENDGKSSAEKLENVLGFLCYIKRKNAIEMPKSQILHSPVLPVHGNKNWMREEHYASIFAQLPSNITSCVELFGGSGILTADASVFGLNCTYNDDDKDKQNFFKCLRDKPADLRMKCIFYSENKNIQISPKSSSLDKAGFFWADSYRQCHSKVGDEKRRNELLEITCQFEQVSEIYKDVQFKNCNALTYAKEFTKDKHLLVIIDPPYPYSKDYSGRNTNNKRSFGMEDLGKIVTNFKNAECIYIIHGRLTAPKDYSKKREEQDLEADTYIRRKIEQLYMDKGLFYKEIPYGNLGTIEYMISNYPFKSFSPFTTENRYGKSYLENDIPETPDTCSETASKEPPATVPSAINADDSSALKKDYIKGKNLRTTLLKQLKRKFANIVQKLRK